MGSLRLINARYRSQGLTTTDQTRYSGAKMRGILADILLKPAGRIVTIVLGVIALVIVLPALHVLPHFSNPFTQTTTQRSSSVVLKSITRMSRYQAASASFQVLVDVKKNSSALPSFLTGSDIAYVDFSHLSGSNVQVSPDRAAVAVSLPQPQLEPAQLDLKDAHVFTEQEGLLTRLGGLFGSGLQTQQQQAIYVQAQSQLQAAAKRSPLLSDARRNTTAMLASLLHGLGFTRVTVTFASKLNSS
jgi:hypothetical protein